MKKEYLELIKKRGGQKMKITFTGTFNLDDVKLINEFLEIQETTDRERENTVIDYDREVEIKVTVNQKGDIVKINFRKI